MLHKNFDLYCVVFLFAAISIMAWSCSSGKKAKPNIMVSILPQKFIVQQIVGDRYDVNVLVPAGFSPESYDPTPKDLMVLSNTDIYFSIGDFGFEVPWMPRLNEANPTMQCFRMSAAITCLEHDMNHEVDPHVWTTPDNMKLMARVVFKAMAVYDPENISFYQANLDDFCKRMDQLHLRIRQQVSIAPSRAFVIYHPALTYFSALYNLKQLSVEQGHKEPSAANMADLMEAIKSSGAKVMLIQQEVDSRLAETIAQECGLRVVRINPLSEDIENELMRIVLAITRN